MSNEQMKGDRFLRWHTARRRLQHILSVIEAGGVVVVATYTKATQFDARHKDYFSATRSGLYARYGKQWLCIDGCAINAYRPKDARHA